MSEKGSSISGKAPTSTTECSCVGQCVGFECLRARASALVASQRVTDARQLLSVALREAHGNTSLQAEIRAVYDVLVGERRDSDLGDTSSLASSPIKRKRLDDIKALDLLAAEIECPICSKLLYEPITTFCGHTFCRACLSRAIDCTDSCPLCRTVLHLEDPAQLPVTHVLHSIIQRCFPSEYRNRKTEVEADAPSVENAMSRLPLFPLNAVVFPAQRFPMHIFEARYRLMLRRIMQGSKKFGLIALKRLPTGCSELCEIGCVLEVTKADRIPDGRSIIETVARERFRVMGRTEKDGYLVGRTEVFRDTEGLDGDEVKEVEARAREIVRLLLDQGAKLSDTSEHSRLSAMQHALQRAGSVPNEEEGPSALGMWLAGMLVSDNSERQRLLELNNAKTRLVEMTAVLERFRDSMIATSKNSFDSAGNSECLIQ